MPCDKKDKNHVAYLKLKQLFDKAPSGVFTAFSMTKFPLDDRYSPHYLPLSEYVEGWPYENQYAKVLDHVSMHLSVMKQEVVGTTNTYNLKEHCTAVWMTWLSKVWECAPHILVKWPDDLKEMIAAKEAFLADKLVGLNEDSPDYTLMVRTQKVIQMIKAELFDEHGNLQNVSNKRLLLEVMSQSIQLAINPKHPINLVPLLDQLEKQNFKPLCKLLKSVVDFAILHWGWAKKLERSGFYASLTRHSDDRKLVADLRKETESQQPK